MTTLESCNRVEVIDHTGRAYVLMQDGIKVALSIQDDGRTLKIFIDGYKSTITNRDA